MAVAGDGDGAVDEGADEGPDEARHGLRPAAHDLQAEGHAVDVGAVVRDDAQGQHDEAELPEAPQRREQHCGQQAPDPGFFVARRVRFRRHRRGHDGQPEDFGEQ